MRNAAREHAPSPDVHVTISAAHAPEEHVAFLDALAEMLAASALNELHEEQTQDGDPSAT